MAKDKTNNKLPASGYDEQLSEPKSPVPDLPGLPELGTDALRDELEQRVGAEREQNERSIDEAVNTGIKELQRAEQDAQEGFRTRRDQIAAEERQALDNQALYAEMRGDRGGIGQAQYASIQNTAALNQQQVNREQQQLAVETARQIADLRAKGEFRKADALLQLTQKHLTELMKIERWAAEKNLSIAEFNSELSRWRLEYAWQLRKYGMDRELKLLTLDQQRELRLMELSGLLPDGTPTLAARQSERAKLAEAAKLLLKAGLDLTPEQREALGWTEEQYQRYLEMQGFQLTAKATTRSEDSGG